MSVLPIVIAGNPVLHTPAKPVETIDETVRELAHSMFSTMDAAPGVGLAAPQVGVPLRLFVYGYTDDDDGQWRGVAINPRLWVSPIDPRPARKDEAEGCLSFPGERFPLVRSAEALLRATNLDGEHYEIHARGWLARIFQHEYDHLEGTLYMDRLAPPHDKLAEKTLRKRFGGDAPGQAWDPSTDSFD